MVRLLVAALVIHSGLSSAAESLHLAPLGTTVSGTFDLAGRPIPLPEGNFVLAARSVTQPPMIGGDISKPRAKIAHVMLVQIEPPRLRAAVLASAVLIEGSSYRFHWSGQPCRKEDVLYRADLTGSRGEDENCLLVDHAVGNFGPRAQGLWKETATWLAEHNVELPVPVLITASVTRNHRWQHVAATYAFNPRMYGCGGPRSRSWAESPWHRSRVGEDAAKVRFVESVTAWGKGVQAGFDELIAGRPPAYERSRIERCAPAPV